MRDANKMLAAVAIVILIGLLYGGAYLAMLVGTRQVAVQDDNSIAPTVSLIQVPRYRVYSSIIQTIFRPANAMDAKLRPEMWKELPLMRPIGQPTPHDSLDLIGP
jgi:hypothetical protein